MMIYGIEKSGTSNHQAIRIRSINGMEIFQIIKKNWRKSKTKLKFPRNAKYLIPIIKNNKS